LHKFDFCPSEGLEGQLSDTLNSLNKKVSIPLTKEIIRMTYALSFWKDTPCVERKYTIKQIFERCIFEGPAFTDILKDQREYGCRKAFTVLGFQPNEKEYFVNDTLKHYNDLPTVDSLIHWAVEEEIRDFFDYQDQDIVDSIPLPDNENKSIFKEFSKSTLAPYVWNSRVPEDIEIISKTNNTVSFDFDGLCGGNEIVPMYLTRSSSLGEYFSPVFRAKRCIIDIAPGNIRDTVISTIDSYNTITWINDYILSVLDQMEESVYHSDASISTRRINTPAKLNERYHHLMIDIKKAGMTIPRELAIAVMEGIIEVMEENNLFPDKLEKFKIRSQIFKNWIVILNDEHGSAVIPKRGFCLGMANNMVTLILILVYRYHKSISDFRPAKMRGFFGNDDSVICIDNDSCFEDPSGLYQFWMDYHYTLASFGIPSNKKKSFVGYHSVFFENYSHNNYRAKEACYASALASTMLCPSIRFAKVHVYSIVSSMKDIELTTSFNNILNRVILEWGYEFFEGESNFDFYLGGWIPFRRDGLSTLLEVCLESRSINLTRKLISAHRIVRATLESMTIIYKPNFQSGQLEQLWGSIAKTRGLRLVDPSRIPDNIPIITNSLISKEEYKKLYKRARDFSLHPHKVFAKVEKSVKRLTSERSSYFRAITSTNDKVSILYSELSEIDLDFSIPQEIISDFAYFVEEDKSSSLSGYCRRGSMPRMLKLLVEEQILASDLIDRSVISCDDYIINNTLINYGGPKSMYKTFRPGNTELGYRDFNQSLDIGRRFSKNPFRSVVEFFKRLGAFPRIIIQGRAPAHKVSPHPIFWKEDLLDEKSFVICWNAIKEIDPGYDKYEYVEDLLRNLNYISERKIEIEKVILPDNLGSSSEKICIKCKYIISRGGLQIDHLSIEDIENSSIKCMLCSWLKRLVSRTNALCSEGYDPTTSTDVMNEVKDIAELISSATNGNLSDYQRVPDSAIKFSLEDIETMSIVELLEPYLESFQEENLDESIDDYEFLEDDLLDFNNYDDNHDFDQLEIDESPELIDDNG
jgi:hypothetical protein